MPRNIIKEATGFPGDEDYDPGKYEDADSLLGAAIPTCTFAEKGTKHSGIILDIATGVQTDPDGTVKRFGDGSARRQVILTLQTNLKDNEDDDGRRRLFVKGQMLKAAREATRKVKAPGPRPGGVITVTYSGDEASTRPGFSGAKVYTVTYKAPVA